jgi:NNP family nitrate/nitrite transporter-like MFS transporter
MIFEPRQAGGVLGWTGAIAAFGPFIFGVLLSLMAPTDFFQAVALFAVVGTAIAWWFYARKGAVAKS